MCSHHPTLRRPTMRRGIGRQALLSSRRKVEAAVMQYLCEIGSGDIGMKRSREKSVSALLRECVTNGTFCRREKALRLPISSLWRRPENHLRRWQCLLRPRLASRSWFLREPQCPPALKGSLTKRRMHPVQLYRGRCPNCEAKLIMVCGTISKMRKRQS